MEMKLSVVVRVVGLVKFGVYDGLNSVVVMVEDGGTVVVVGVDGG